MAFDLGDVLPHSRGLETESIPISQEDSSQYSKITFESYLTFAEHLYDSPALFTQIREHKLRVNRAKCCFFGQSVKFLGHIITPEEVLPDPEKVKATQDMVPATKEKLLR